MNTALWESHVATLESVTQRLVKLWWRLDALMARWKKAMGDGFDDPYQGHPLQNKDLAELIRLAAKLGWHYHEGNSCDEGGIKKWVATATGALFVAFIIGGWALSNQVSSMNATMVARFNEQDRRFNEQNARILELEKQRKRGYRDDSP